MRPHSLLRLWRYINHLLTYLLTYLLMAKISLKVKVADGIATDTNAVQ